MKQPKKLTRAQKELLSKKFKSKINVEDWMLVKETGDEIQIVNKKTNQIKVISK